MLELKGFRSSIEIQHCLTIIQHHQTNYKAKMNIFNSMIKP
jgi:hypothetical protein